MEHWDGRIIIGVRLDGKEFVETGSAASPLLCSAQKGFTRVKRMIRYPIPMSLVHVSLSE